jgi:hypothetical protein
MYYRIEDGKLQWTEQPPPATSPFDQLAPHLLPPAISALHTALYAWQQLQLLPGPVRPERVWVGIEGALAFTFLPGQRPVPLLSVGVAPVLAAWLVMLDQRIETFVVIARARAVWTPRELAGALTFTTPAYLPPELVARAPDSWIRVARALAIAVADGPLQGGESHNRHWVTHKVRP